MNKKVINPCKISGTCKDGMTNKNTGTKTYFLLVGHHLQLEATAIEMSSACTKRS